MGCYGPKWNTTYPRETSNCFFVLDGRLSFWCLLRFPPLRKLHLIQKSFPKPKPEDRRTSRVCLPPRSATRHGPVIYGSQPTSSCVHYVLCFKGTSALSSVCSGLGSCSAFCFHCPSVSLHLRLFMCVESSGICWTRKSSQTDGLF